VEAALPPALSEREVAVLKLMMRGEENTQIGQRLFISTSTVKDRISAILEKLGVANRVQAAVCAVRAGLG
jgi:DNA-binding NarL/FixJ family response regulator